MYLIIMKSDFKPTLLELEVALQKLKQYLNYHSKEIVLLTCKELQRLIAALNPSLEPILAYKLYTAALAHGRAILRNTILFEAHHQ